MSKTIYLILFFCLIIIIGIAAAEAGIADLRADTPHLISDAISSIAAIFSQM